MLKKDELELNHVKRKSTRVQRSNNRKHFSENEKMLEVFDAIRLLAQLEKDGDSCVSVSWMSGQNGTRNMYCWPLCALIFLHSLAESSITWSDGC